MVFNRGHKYNARRDEEFQLQRGIYKNGMRKLANILYYIYLFVIRTVDLMHTSLSYTHVINIYLLT